MMNLLEQERVLEIANNEALSFEERMELMAQAGETITDVVRIIYLNEELELEEGQIIDNVGLHWTDMNDEFNRGEGYDGSHIGDTEAIFFVKGAKGYKIPYFNEIWAESNGKTYEEQMEMVAEYERLYEVVGTEEDAFQECEILISNNTKFEIVRVQAPNEETNWYEVELEIVK